MAPLLHARKRTIAGRIRSLTTGLGKRASAKTTIVNSTSSTVVLRNKYRDVWEEARFRLRQGESIVVRWAPGKPYERLGAFVESTPTTSKGKKLLQPTIPLLLIGQSTIACHTKIVLSSSKSGNHYERPFYSRAPAALLALVCKRMFILNKDHTNA